MISLREAVSKLAMVILTTDLILLIISSSSSSLVDAQANYPSVAYPPSSWKNFPAFDFSLWDHAGITPILTTANFVCGFHCTAQQRDHCLFAVSIFQTNSINASGDIALSSKVVWSANRNNPIIQPRLSATQAAVLQLSEKGGLMLRDGDGNLVWSTNTAGDKFVSVLNLTEQGNLVLHGRNNEVFWQSFDHPTDALVPGQALFPGQKLTASVSNSNTSAGSYSLALTNGSLIAFVESADGQQVYFGPLKLEISTHDDDDEQHRVAAYINGRFGRFLLPSTPEPQFIKLESDGHLRAYQLMRTSKWEQVSDLFAITGACGYPLACGEYGVCSDHGDCSCPKAKAEDSVSLYFSQVSENNPNLGCSENIPISCNIPSDHDYHNHSLLELEDIDYFNLIPHAKNIANREKCKEACLKNCSCKAAVHRQQINSSVGYCFLLSKVLFSFKRNVENLHDYNSFTYIKVQKQIPLPKRAKKPSKARIIVILGSTLLFILFVVVGMIILLFSIRRNKNASKDDHNQEEKKKKKKKHQKLRLSYEELVNATENFSVKLGEGGFGSVFYGTLPNGNKIAVKRLNMGTGRHVKKSFFAEVETLGSVHHINLVTLIGYCAENKSHPLLVYEYLENGSLDKWIFTGALSWKSRLRIIRNVAEGLAYLHHDWNGKIFHLDIKPHNILLDENFNARLADFGLSKLIDRDQQNHVFTTMRGTPGYMAPEWSSATITEKADVYSFGIVVMEILCGRRNVDRSQPEEEEMHLLRVFAKKAGEGKLPEMVDKSGQDMQLNVGGAVEMMRIAAWCLQRDYTRRPSMRKVLNVLNGYSNVEDDLSYDFLNSEAPREIAVAPSSRVGTTALAIPSVLSGPR